MHKKNRCTLGEERSGGTPVLLCLPLFLPLGDLIRGGRDIALFVIFQCADPAIQLGDALGDDVRQILLVEVVGGVDGLVVDPHHFGRHADGGAVGGQVAEHDAAGTDAGIVADVDRAEDFGARTDQDIVAKGGVPLAGILAGAAEGHAVVDGAVVADLSGLAEHDAHAVVDEQTLADGGTGVDLDAGAVASVLADPPRKEEMLVLIQPMGDAVIDQNVKTGV